MWLVDTLPYIHVVGWYITIHTCGWLIHYHAYMWLVDTLPYIHVVGWYITNHPWLAMDRNTMKKKFCPHIIHPVWCPGWFTLGDFSWEREWEEPQEGRQIRPFYSAKSLKDMAEEGTPPELGGGTAGGDQSEPAPTSTPCRMKWYVDRKHFSIVIPSLN
jgi:hypothetical protein